MTTKKTIDEILNGYFFLNQAETMEEVQAFKGITAQERLKQDLSDLIDEIIGKDEPVSYGVVQIGNTPEEDRNELREEQRFRKQELFK